MSIIKVIKKNFESAKDKKWDRTFWAFDVHETIIVPNYKYGDIPKQFYPFAKEVLQEISNRNDVDLIMFTSSWPEEIEEYKKLFKENKIIFKYVNENPDVPNFGYGFYERKFYFNILFEDKAGFDPFTDWLKIKEVLSEYPDIDYSKT